MTGGGTTGDIETGDAALARVLGALRPELAVTGGPDEGARGRGRFEPQAEHRGNPGWLHGGLAATLLDHVCARTAAAVLGGPVVTATLDLRYRRPVALADGPYRVEAEAGPARGRRVRVSGAVLDPDGRPLVQARGLFLVRPPLADG